MAWRDGSVHLAEIVETRKGEDADVAGGSHGPSESRSTENDGGGGRGGKGRGAKVGSVYVHYVDFDRRLDEWVSMDRVDLASGQQRASAAHSNVDKRRVTRMKRKCGFFGISLDQLVVM